MTIHEELHRLVDQLPNNTLDDARRALITLVAQEDPVLKSMIEAQEDDEPTTPEEDTSTVGAWQAYLRGEYMTAQEAEGEFLS